nr:uncharacterized protein LOC109190975 isoform X4 [Ipomoea trifida]
MTETGKFCRKRSQRRAHAPARGVGVPATGMGGLGSPETVEVIGSTDLSKTLTNSKSTVIKDLNVQDRKTANFMHNMNSPWEKPLEVFEEPYLCFPLRNLFLYFPGCISVDEKGNRVFVSDSNHHRIIVFDANGEILDSIGSSPGFEDGDFESAKLMRSAAFFYHAADNCLYIADSEVCAAQQWYDELDHRTFWESELESNKVHSSTESSVEVLSSSPSEVVPEGKVLIDCCINTSPGTSEVIISAALYLKLRKTADTDMDSREQKAAKIADSSDPTRRVSKDLLVSYLLASKRDLEGLIVTRPLQVRLKFECPNYPTSEDNSKEIIITNSSINVSVSLLNP